MNIMKGQITVYNKAAKFGYLRDEQGKEYCFYEQAIQTLNKSVNKGDKVEFEILRGHGVRAVNIKTIQEKDGIELKKTYNKESPINV